MGADELGRIAVNALLTRTGIDPGTDRRSHFRLRRPAGGGGQCGARHRSARRHPGTGPRDHRPSQLRIRDGIVHQAYEKMVAGRGRHLPRGRDREHVPNALLLQESAAAKFSKLARAKSTAKMKAMAAFRPADFQPRIGLQLGLTDPVCGLNMGETAEILAREYGFTASCRMPSPWNRIPGLSRPGNDWPRRSARSTPRKERRSRRTTARAKNRPSKCSGKLRPVFDRKNGTVTAGNSSQITDGAVALLVMTEEKAARTGLKPLGALRGYAYAGCDPCGWALGRCTRSRKRKRKSASRWMMRTGGNQRSLRGAGAGGLEVLRSEEFAQKHLGRNRPVGKIAKERLNVNGGSIALGHPVGATGARFIFTSLKELKRRQAQRALVSFVLVVARARPSGWRGL